MLPPSTLSLFFKQLKNNNMDTKQHKDVYQIVTDQIVSLLEQDIVPWKKTWTDAGLPRNLISKKPYRGINMLLLNSLNYAQNLFLTFDQVKKIGGSVKKDEKSHLVVFTKWIDTDEEDEKGKKKQKPMLRYYRVFNIAQCTGIPLDLVPQITRESHPILACEHIIRHMQNKPLIRYDENLAYYHPKLDYVNMPEMKYFIKEEAYYATFFHELIHSTGHESRLKRKEVMEPTNYGTYDYSMEELVAEIGSCYLQSMTGIYPDTVSNSGAYIQGWIAKLKN
jgi:antirestriction protein ArdC